MTKAEIKETKTKFIEFLKEEILPYYDGFNYHQKLNLLCDDITQNDTINIIYHKILSNKNYCRLINAISHSSQRNKLTDEFINLFYTLMSYSNLKR